MTTETTSSQILAECLKQHGKGEQFFRTDGLEFEARRSELRDKFLAEHPSIAEAHRESILKAAVVPGMTKEEITAAWGLLEEDTRLSFGHVTDDRNAAYAFFTLEVGELYALYFKDNLLIGVRRVDELVPPHEQELTMRLAEEYFGLYYFSDRYEGGLIGEDVYQDEQNWASGGLFAGRTQVVHPWPVERIEQHIRSKNLFSDYDAALDRFGYDRANLSAAECARAALTVLPYPPLPQEVCYFNVLDDEGNPMPLRLQPTIPSDAWFWHVANGRARVARFPTTDGGIETLPVRWLKENIFVVNDVPLRVNGVSQFDRVLVEWRDDDPIPFFKQVAKNEGYRTVRVTLTDANSERYLDRFVAENEPNLGRYRYEDGVLAFTLASSTLDVEYRRALWLPGILWIHTDTLSQD